MVLKFFYRNGLTVLGGLAIAGVVVFGALSIGGATVGGLVETEMRTKGENFARLLTQPGGTSPAPPSDSGPVSRRVCHAR